MIQGEFYLDLPTLLVVPLYPEHQVDRFEVINPVLMADGMPLVAKMEQIAAIAPNGLGALIDNVERDGLTIQNAIDRLFSGY